MRIKLPTKNILAVMGSYGDFPVDPNSSMASYFVRSIYGTKVKVVEAWDSEIKAQEIPFEVNDTSIVVDIYRRFIFDNSPCFEVTDIKRTLDLLADTPKESYRFLALYDFTIVCVKDSDLALKVKLSV